LTASIKAIVFEPDCFLMASETDCTLSSDAAVVGSTPPSSTRAMSLIFTGKLLRVTMTISLN